MQITATYASRRCCDLASVINGPPGRLNLRAMNHRPHLPAVVQY
jgi:hypothetical protein